MGKIKIFSENNTATFNEITEQLSMNANTDNTTLILKINTMTNRDTIKWIKVGQYITDHKENESLKAFFNDNHECGYGKRYIDLSISYCAAYEQSIIILFAIRNEGWNDPLYSIALQSDNNGEVTEYSVWGDDQSRLEALNNIIKRIINNNNSFYNSILSCDA